MKDVRRSAGMPRLSDFASSDGTPVVIDISTSIPYYLKNNVPTPLASPTTVAAAVVMGGIRKTTDQTIGTLGASWVPIMNYTSQVFSNHPYVTTDLTAGTISFAKAGDYMLTANIEMTFTPDNNSSRKTGLRLFVVTDNAAIPNASVNLYAGGYTAGFANSSSIPVQLSAAMVGKNLRFEVGGGDTFAAAILRTVLLSAVSLGPIS